MQPNRAENDPTFVWKTRLEFVEQLLDLRNDTLYIVEPGELDRYTYEEARLREIVKPVVYWGHMLLPEDGIVATLDDVPRIENRELNRLYYLCSEQYFLSRRDTLNVQEQSGYVFNFDNNPLVPSNYISNIALFYDKEWAIKYQVALTAFLSYNADAFRQ
jgi:hypothetical protein